MREAEYYTDRPEEFDELAFEDQIKVLQELFGESRESAIAIIEEAK